MMKLFMPRYGALLAMLLAFSCLYFNWEIRFSPRGVIALGQINGQAATLKAKLAELQGVRVKFENHVALLRTESLDPDMLDETARRELGYLGENELIIPITQ
jgi:cell division protein FtsB